MINYAGSFGAKGYRVESADALLPTLQQAIADDSVVLIDCPLDCSENMKLIENRGSWSVLSSQQINFGETMTR